MHVHVHMRVNVSSNLNIQAHVHVQVIMHAHVIVHAQVIVHAHVHVHVHANVQMCVCWQRCLAQDGASIHQVELCCLVSKNTIDRIRWSKLHQLAWHCFALPRTESHQCPPILKFLQSLDSPIDKHS